MEATAVVKLGPVKACFKSDVTLDATLGPEKFDLSGKGYAGVAGVANGGAKVTLAAQDGSTLLAYVVTIDVTGKLAQVGSSLMGRYYQTRSQKFFANFEQVLTNDDLSA